MKYRDSSASVHFLHGAIVGGEDKWANGVELMPAASGAYPVVQAVADESTKALRVTGKADGVQIGSTAGLVVQGIYSTTFAWEHANLSSGQSEEITLASTTADVLPGDLVSISLEEVSAAVGTMGYRQSTAAASRVTIVVAVPGSSAVGSTQSGTGRITWVDLT